MSPLLFMVYLGWTNFKIMCDCKNVEIETTKLNKLRAMEERLKIFINELKDRQCKAEAISSRESNLDGNKMLKNENNGKYIAYSHCIRKLADILREGQKEQNPAEALHKHGVVGSATTHAAITINFISTVIHGLQNGKVPNLIKADLQNAKDHFEILLTKLE